MSLHWLPLVHSFVLLLSIVIPWVSSPMNPSPIVFPHIFPRYGLAVGLGHLRPFLPYISDAGVLLPERAFFGELVNLGAFLQALVAYVRFEQVKLCEWVWLWTIAILGNRSQRLRSEEGLGLVESNWLLDRLVEFDGFDLNRKFPAGNRLQRSRS